LNENTASDTLPGKQKNYCRRNHAFLPKEMTGLIKGISHSFLVMMAEPEIKLMAKIFLKA